MIGIVSERNIVEDAVAKDIDVDVTKISEIMSSDLITVDAETLLDDALKVLTVGNLRTVRLWKMVNA